MAKPKSLVPRSSQGITTRKPQGVAPRSSQGIIRADDIPARGELPTVAHNPDGEIDLSEDEIASFAGGSAKALRTMAEKFKYVSGKTDVTLTHFWTCLVFVSMEQRDEFIDALEKLGLNMRDETRMFLPGYSVAKLLGITLQEGSLPRKPRIADYDSLAMDLPPAVHSGLPILKPEGGDSNGD